jgi:hypothetical protein
LGVAEGFEVLVGEVEAGGVVGEVGGDDADWAAGGEVGEVGGAEGDGAGGRELMEGGGEGGEGGVGDVAEEFEGDVEVLGFGEGDVAGVTPLLLRIGGEPVALELGEVVAGGGGEVEGEEEAHGRDCRPGAGDERQVAKTPRKKRQGGEGRKQRAESRGIKSPLRVPLSISSFLSLSFLAFPLAAWHLDVCPGLRA